MSSQLNVDTIVDKAGSGGTNVKIGNTSVTVAEGGSGTTNTVQGLAKGWLKFDQNNIVPGFSLNFFFILLNSNIVSSIIKIDDHVRILSSIIYTVSVFSFTNLNSFDS